MIKVKEFACGGSRSADEQINTFLKEVNGEYIDLKITGVKNTFTTQCDYIALLIYKDDEIEKETKEILGESLKDVMEQNKRYREAIEKASKNEEQFMGDHESDTYKILTEALED